MVEAGAKEVPEDEVVGALDAAHAAIKQIVAAHRRAGRPRPASTKLVQARGQGSTRRSSSAIEGKVLGPLDRRRCASRASSRTTRTVDKVLDGAHRRRCRKTRPSAQGRGQAHLPRPAGEGAARRDPRARRAPRRPQVRRDPPDLDRGRRAAARPRLGRVHARRDPGAGHRARSAPPTTSRRSSTVDGEI